MKRTLAPARPDARLSMTLLMSACVVVVVAMVAAINLALPELASSSLRPSSAALLWIVDGYILAFGCLLIPAGALADRYGRKGVLLAGLATFAAGCLASAAAPSVALLLGARVLTGVGAALVMPATLSLLLQVTPPDRKPHAIAAWSAATGAAGALGNLGGGLILQWLPWQGLFLTMAALATVLGLAVARVAPPGERRAATLDPVGAALVAGSVLFALFAIIESAERGWTSPLVLAAATGAVALAIAFVRHGLRRADPMLDPRIFTIPRVRAASVGIAAVFFGLFALFFVNAQYLQYAKGYSPLVTGVAILPLPLAMILVSRRSVGFARRYGADTVVVTGLVTLAAGLVVLSLADAATSYPPYATGLLLVAAGMGLSVPSLSTAIVTSLPPAQAGIGSGINSAVRELGAALGVATIGAILANNFEHRLPTGLQVRGSIFETLREAEASGPRIHERAIGSFTDSMALGLRSIAVVVLVGAVVVALSNRASRRTATAAGALDAVAVGSSVVSSTPSVRIPSAGTAHES